MRYLFWSLLFVVYPLSAYEYKEPLESPIELADFYAKHGAPEVSIYKTNKDCTGECAYTVNMGNGRGYQTRRAGDAEIFAQAQYGNTAYAYVRVKYECGERRDCRDYTMYSSHNATRFPGPSCRRAMTRHVDGNGNLMCLHEDKLELHGSRGHIRNIELPVKARYGTGAIGNNLSGQTAVAFIGHDDNKLYTSNSYANWVSAETNLHHRSDFNGIVAPYPVKNDETVVGVYEWLNVRNRGVSLYRFSNNSLYSSGYLVNTPRFNYGSNMDVFGRGSDLYVTAQNTSTRDRQTYQLSTYDLWNLGLDEAGEEVRMASPRASSIDMMFGYGVTQNSWEVNQKIRTGDDTRARATYDMNDSILHNYYMQGRYRDTQVTVNYLTSEAEESDNNLVSKGTELLTAVVDFNGFFDGAMTLRLELEKMAAGGTVNYYDDNSNAFHHAFETDYNMYGLSFVMEEGLYLGLRVSNYDAPSAVGFEKKNGRYQGAAFDRDFSVDRYMLVLGYDETSYGGRYELDYNRFYIDGEFGLGLNKLNVSRDALEDAVGSREGKIYGRYALAVTSAVELGYTYQRRSARLRGLGFSLQAGYRAKVDWTYQSPSDSASSDEYYLLYERTDLWHGPFVQFNAIF
ncbi:hypothetical protein [Thaumasiovibrio sp. DFM-14]|uniref:hypothetical protein n=1 Tax=Thaumasiovibrio sp. DFM-14 TaxID=3384792 RepID=UPI00399EFC86